MQYSGTWKEIWTQKGEMDGGVNDIAVYDGWERSSASIEEIAERIKKAVHAKVGHKVLEVGCGAGGVLRFFEGDVMGVDFSGPLTKKCMEFFQIPAICSEANKLPFCDEYFDVCFSWGVFLYFPTLEYALEVINEMKRVTSPGGVIFIGDIPMESHSDRHMTYTKEWFEEKGFVTMKGWAEPYCDVRFNAILK
jgi:Methylase involved in ubiquinone/menaquinone biosynthesis